MPQTQYNLHLKGFVGGADFDRNYVDYVLSRNVDKPVNVLIDSLGGSVATALSIASAFRNHADVSVHFVGMNASAATIASLGAKHISIDANAMYLVHKCSQAFFEWGSLNADQFAQLIADCQQMKDDLDKLDVNIASMYSNKCKKNPKDLLDLMAKGGWLNAKEALEWGFVDEITDLADEPAPKLTDSVASAMAAAGMPIPNVPVADKECFPPTSAAPRKSSSELDSSLGLHEVSAFAKFLASLGSLFNWRANREQSRVYSDSAEVQPTEDVVKSQKPESPQPLTVMSNLFPLICAALGIEALALTDNVASLTSVNLTALEDALAQRDSRIAQLTAQIETLKQSPGDSTSAVVENNKPTQTSNSSPLNDYCSRVNEAQKIFKALP